MKMTFPTMLATASFLLTVPLAAQDKPSGKPEQPAPAPGKQPAPATPASPAKPATPATPPATPIPPLVPAAPKLDPAVVKTNSSYGFGYRAGRGFTAQTGRLGLQWSDVDREAFLKGLFDAVELKDSAIKQEDVNAALTALSQQIKEREAKLAVTNKEAGAKFLEENKKREGVTTTESGLQYEILTKGEGEVYAAPPEGQAPNKLFMVVYRGTLPDGTEFDSTNGEVRSMSLNVIPGFKEALTTMPVGSKWRLFIPSELGYGERRRSAKLGPNSTLIFDLELKELKDAPQAPNRPNFSQPPGTRRPDNRPRAISPPVRVPPLPDKDKTQSSKPTARAVSPPVRIPIPPKKDDSKESSESTPKPAESSKTPAPPAKKPDSPK